MTGDTDIAEQFRDLLRFATPDLEEELSRLVGDPLAHQAGNAARARSFIAAGASSSEWRGVGLQQTLIRVSPT